MRTLCSEWAGNTAALNWRNEYGNTPLITACYKDRHEVVSVLIGTAGVDLNMASNDGWSPLWIAAYNGRTQSVRVLLSAKERGLDLNQKSISGKTPLTIARENKRAEVVALLEAAGTRDVSMAWIAALVAVAAVASVVVWRSLSPRSCLSIASTLSLGSSICTRPPGPKALYNPTEGTGKRLYDAASNGMDDEVRDLSTEWAGNTAILNFKDSTGKTALFWACSNELPKTAAILITTSGVGVNEVDDNGQSPLWIAAYECNPDIVGMLLSVKGIYTNQVSTDRDYKDYTPVEIAKKNPKSNNGCAEVVGQLKKAGAPAIYVYPSGPKANWAVPDGVGKRLYDAAVNVDVVSDF